MFCIGDVPTAVHQDLENMQTPTGSLSLKRDESVPRKGAFDDGLQVVVG